MDLLDAMRCRKCDPVSKSKDWTGSSISAEHKKMRTVKEQQLQERIDELLAENSLWQQEAKRWRDMYMEFDEMLEERVNEAVQRLEKVWDGLDELKKKVEDQY